MRSQPGQPGQAQAWRHRQRYRRRRVFFRAEDGIRAFHVTGVQTCALPISAAGIGRGAALALAAEGAALVVTDVDEAGVRETARLIGEARSEERRVGKASGTWRWPDH